MDEINEIILEKSFKIELSTDKHNTYLIEFTIDNYINIVANLKYNNTHKLFFCKYSFVEIRENKYFLQFDSLNKYLMN